MIRKLTAFLALASLLAACASPIDVPAGPAVTTPELADGVFVMSDGARLPEQSWLPKSAEGKPDAPKAVLIGVHGMNDYSNAFAMPASYFAKHGIATYAYDQRGFGRAPDRGHWAGTRTMVDDMAEVTDLVRKKYPDTPVYLFGLSMGCAVILAAAGEHKLPNVDGVILSSPAVWGWHSMNVAYKLALWTSAHVWPGKTLSGSRLEIWPSDNIAMLRAYSKDPLVIKQTRIGTIYGLVTLMDRGYLGARDLDVPTLVLYGKKDEIVPEAPVMHVAKIIPAPKRILEYDYGYHMLQRDLDRVVVYRDVDAWLLNHNAPMPSVAGESSGPSFADEIAFGTDTGVPRPAIKQATMGP
jgi:acylglycerol lipase